MGDAQARMPTEQSAFTAEIATRLASRLPDMQIEVRGPLTLSITSPSGGSFQANLDRTWNFCRRNPEDCDTVALAYVDRAPSIIREALIPITADSLKIIVRPSDYVTPTTDLQLVAGKIVGDIWWIIVIDTPTSTRTLNSKNLEGLGLTQERAYEIARSNVEKGLKPSSAVAQSLPPGAIGTIVGGYFESSRILFPEKWEELSKAMGGQLIVATPSPELVLFADGSTPMAVDAFAAFAQEQSRRSERPLLPTVLRWTPTGWQVAH